MSIRHRHYLKGKEVQEMLLELKTTIPSISLDDLRDRRIEVASLNADENLYLIDGKPFLLKTDEDLFPTLRNSEILGSIPTIIVDAGAIPHICNGSDLMYQE